MEQSADYVVVGAGSAGAIVARRLADTGASVVLIEGGGPDKGKLYRTPGMIGPMHSVPQVKKKVDWGYYSAPQKYALDRTIPQTRGKVLGGSSSINGMVFVRGNRKNYDDWAAQGCTGWSYDDVLPSFKRFEDWEDGASDYRGVGGPIRVTRPKNRTEASGMFMQAFSESVGVKILDDYNAEDQEGISVFQQSASKGLRSSTSVGYLDNHGRPNLTVVTSAVVSKVVFDGNRAVGVEIGTGAGRRTIRANAEVILSAGVYGSAQVLMLSGVGPAAHLREHGIDVRADLPVGDNLHDHLFVPMTYLMPSGRNRGTAGYFARGLIKESLRPGSSFLANTVFESVAFVRSSLAGEIPDIQMHLLPWSYPSPNQDAPVRHKVDTRCALTLMSTLIYPRSRGTVRLASADPTAAPIIDPRYLEDPNDTEVLLDGMELIRETMANRLIAGSVTAELHPGPSYPDRAALAREIPNRATTVYHPVGTCRMGVDEQAVVDPSLRVRGVEGLRVADASIMPSITGGNTNAPAMMIGERAAELIVQG